MKLLISVFLALFCGLAHATGTVSVAYALNHYETGGQGKLEKTVTISWTSDASGDATSAITLNGYVQKIVTVPDGSAAPTANYDITLVQNGVDQLVSLLANRATATNELVFGIAKNSSDVGPVPIFLIGSHTFTVANAGNAKSGVVYIYLTDRP